MKFVLLLVAVVAAKAIAFADDTRPAGRLPQDAIDALESGTEFVLYSLDPGPVTMQPQHIKPEENFNEFKILGRLPLSNSKARFIAVGSVIDAIRKSDPQLQALCFFPRHALRVTNANGQIFDFVICYECGQIRLYEKGIVVATIGIPSAPEALNRILSDAAIPLAKPPANR